MFSLRLLGGARVEGPQGPLTGRLAQRKRLALLAVLAVARRPISRDRLLALFWPEADSERARHSLADSVYHIRRELGDAAVVSQGEDLWLDTAVVASDVAEFEDAAARGDLLAAADSWSGAFLDGFHVSDAPGFEHWADEQRDRLARLHAHVLERLAEEAAARGDAQTASAWWRRLGAIDPLNSRVALRLMQALEDAGDRAGAIQHARLHATLLEQELGAAPDAEVAAFAERLRRGTAPVVARAQVQPPAAPAPVEPVPEPSALHATSTSPVTRQRLRTGVAALLGVAGLIVIVFAALRGAGNAPTGAAVAAAPGHVLVVLPCSNLNGDPAEDPFSDGLTEELIATLSQLHALRVVARTSAFAFKGQNRDVREIARLLSVSAIVECSVRRAGERFRVTAQLINAADGLHLWAETYQREGTDVLEIQHDLALHIAQGLQAELTPGERARLAHRPAIRPEAYALYLKGRHFWNQRTAGAYRQAIEYFERALALDSGYAAAWAGLARAYSLQGLSGHMTPDDARQRMRAAVRRAVQLDDESAEASAELGAYLHVYEWDTAAAERAYQRAIALDPGYSLAHHLYGNLLDGVGRRNEALVQRRLALQHDPLSPQLNVSLGQSLLLAGRTDQALAAFRDAIELDTLAWTGHVALGELYVITGRTEEALQAHRRAAELAPDHVDALAGFARTLVRAGREEEARRLVTQLTATCESRHSYLPSVALALLMLGEADAAYQWLERAYAQRHPRLRLIGGSPALQGVTEPRILDLLQSAAR